MKIALISPKGALYRHKSGIFKKSLRYQPLTLTTLAALIPDNLQAEVALYDEGISELPTHVDADLIGITAITGTALRAYELATAFRKAGKTVVLGGPHITLMPEEAALHADAICVGYAEDSWPALLQDFANGCLKPVYRQAPDFSLNRPQMPFARRDLFQKKDFLTQAVFEATRSCTHDCEFCVAPTAWGRQHYQKPIDWVIEDIRRVGAKKILFVDLNLIADKEYAKELFTRMMPLKVQWFGLSTVLLAHDLELLELLAKSGCRGLLLGLETVNEASLQDSKKRFNGSVSFLDFIHALHDFKIAVQGCFVFWLDHDTKDVFEATVEFAIDAGVDLPRFAVLTPFPNTPLYHRLSNEGRILTKNWDLYDAQHVVFSPRRMSALELAQGHERAWKSVYRHSAILKRLWQARNFEPLAFAANLGYRFYAHHLHQFYTCDFPFGMAQAGATSSASHAPVLPKNDQGIEVISSDVRTLCG